MKIQICKSKRNSQKWFFRILAANGRKLCHSETYVNKGDCLRAVRSIKARATNAEIESA